MRREDEFDTFYTSTREALVRQTVALTGDLPAARAAVRDAYVVAWSRWHKVSARDDPQEWVRRTAPAAQQGEPLRRVATGFHHPTSG